jgi:tetratricopeptide (TPR) repeat protein
MRRWITRHRFVLTALFGPAIAFSAMTTAPIAQTERETAALDTLFAELKSAPDEEAARVITNQIWVYWTTPADPVLAARMRDVLMLRQQADFPAVIAALDDIVAEYPGYAEGWNQRATIYYLLSNYEQSLADIEKVLEFEPRHFGALVGRAVIHENQGEHALALRDMAAALAIHPFLAERALFPELLEDVTRI